MAVPKTLVLTTKPPSEDTTTRQSSNKYVIITIILVILAVVSTSTAIYFALKYYDVRGQLNQNSTAEIVPSEDDTGASMQTISKEKLRIVRRGEWVAQPPQQPLDPLKHPVPYVIILHTATDNCTTQAKCTFFVRKTQTFHIESFGWWDISYSFLVGGDGFVYEGRGWDGLGAFAYGYNNRSIGISFIGTFIKVLPPPQQIQAAKQLIVEGVRLGKISPNYKLLAHRQVSATESPGEAFYENIKTWDHWAESP